VQRLGKNHGGYFGEIIDIRAVLEDIRQAAEPHGWKSEMFHVAGGVAMPAWRRAATEVRPPNQNPLRIYLSSGIHGDEPAGPLAALQLLRDNRWPAAADLWLVPCLNPTGFILNTRENEGRKDLNRDYRHLDTEEIAAHVRWLEKQPEFDVGLCLHEDWESHGFYVYELNPDQRPALAPGMVKAVAPVCPIDLSPEIEGREAKGGIITPSMNPADRPLWPEAFWLLQHKTRHTCTLEAPSDFPLPTRVNALVAAVNSALETMAVGQIQAQQKSG